MKKALLIRATEHGSEFVRIPFEEVGDRLAFYYKNLECDCIDIVEGFGLRTPADLIVDDEALCKDEYILNTGASFAYGYLQHGQPIVGHALIVKPIPTDDGIEEGGFTDKELDQIMGEISEQALIYMMKGGGNK